MGESQVETCIAFNMRIQNLSEINLKPNNSKSTVIIFTLRQQRDDTSPAGMAGDVLVENVCSAKVLGVLSEFDLE